MFGPVLFWRLTVGIFWNVIAQAQALAALLPHDGRFGQVLCSMTLHNTIMYKKTVG